MIQVTKTFLPPQQEYQEILSRAWSKNWLTNRGVLVQELEGKLKDFLDVPFLTLTTNGTLPIQIAIKAFGLKGDILTTPFSYVATTSSIVWENCNPIFVDIDEQHLTIDESKIEDSITDKTVAILATHVFGNPCAIEAIDRIAKKHKLKVIYDAAHCFGVKYKGKSIFQFGDINTCSFHATKIFHTGEGGCWTTNDEALQEKLFYHHNFGHDGPDNFKGLGMNAKMSELQAAMGLAVFNHLEEIFSSRAEIVSRYDDLLSFSKARKMTLREGTDWNSHYYPLILESEELLLRFKSKLNDLGISPRRYFYPSLNKMAYVSESSMPISESISSRILCLPLYHDLDLGTQEQIASTLKNL